MKKKNDKMLQTNLVSFAKKSSELLFFVSFTPIVFALIMKGNNDKMSYKNLLFI